MYKDAILSCKICGRNFEFPKLLQRHLKNHAEVKRYLCMFCGKGFNDTFDLKRHTRTHTGKFFSSYLLHGGNTEIATCAVDRAGTAKSYCRPRRWRPPNYTGKTVHVHAKHNIH